MFCQNCGNVIAEKAKFCNACGCAAVLVALDVEEVQPEEMAGETILFTPAQEEIAIPVEASQSPEVPQSYPGLALAKSSASLVATAEQGHTLQAALHEESTPILTGKKKRGKSLILLALLVVVLVVLVVGAVKLLPSLWGGKSSYAYLSEDGELMYMKKLSGDAATTELNDEMATDMKFSEDGKYLYFCTAEGELYVIPTVEAGKKDASPERISSDVGQWSTVTGGKIVYLRDGQLRYYDGKDSTKLGGNAEYFAINGDYVYYTEMDYSNNYTITLYRVKLSADGQREKLISGVDEIFSSWFADVLVIGKMSEDTGEYDIYTAKPGEKGEKVLSDVVGVYAANGANGQASFYYTTQQTAESLLYNFVSDSMAQIDEATVEPYVGNYEIYKEYSGYYYSYYGGDWVTDWDAYYAALEKWYPTEARNSMRNQLRNQSRLTTTYTLMKYENGKETEIASGIDSLGIQSAEAGVFVYSKTDNAVRVVADVAELEYASQVNELIQAESVWYQNVGGAESKLMFDEDFEPISIHVLNETTAILAVYDTSEESRVLLDCTIGKGGLTSNGTVTDEYQNAHYMDAGDGKKTLYYWEDGNNEQGTLVRYQDGKKTTVAKDADNVYMLAGGTTCFATGDADSNSNTYTLTLVKDGLETRVADDVTAQTIMGEKKVAYVSEEDLYFWNGSESERIATGVLRFWSSDEVQTTALWYNQAGGGAESWYNY